MRRELGLALLVLVTHPFAVAWGLVKEAGGMLSKAIHHPEGCGCARCEEARAYRRPRGSDKVTAVVSNGWAAWRCPCGAYNESQYKERPICWDCGRAV